MIIIKVIFLDIDGVMISGASTIRNYGQQNFGLTLHPEHVEALNFILENTDARIVVSSTYRWMYSVKQLKLLFHKNGINHKYVISSTPFIKDAQRGDEIMKWVNLYPEIAKKRFGNKVDCNIESFVVLDDDNDMSTIPKGKFVQVNRNYGLTHWDAIKTIRVLNGRDMLPQKIIKRGM